LTIRALPRMGNVAYPSETGITPILLCEVIDFYNREEGHLSKEQVRATFQRIDEAMSPALVALDAGPGDPLASAAAIAKGRIAVGALHH